MNRISEENMALVSDWTGEDVSGWLSSEKLDGCRAYWDGEQLWSRGGNVIDAPAKFTNKLPAGIHLDGEIFAGRDGFEKARVAVQYGKWCDEIEFVVFDAPEVSGRWLSRMVVVHTCLIGCVVARAIESFPVVDEAHMLRVFDNVKVLGGEGVVLRDPEQLDYQVGRCDGLLRVKYADQGEW